jgi:hypothetical protein
LTKYISLAEDPVSSDRWLMAEAEGKPQLGAYLPESDEPMLTVYWRGAVKVTELSHIIDEAQWALGARGDTVEGVLIAYGNTRESRGPTQYKVSAYLDSSSSSNLSGFDAYRAELNGIAGSIVIWANVTGRDAADLRNGGENIGLCITPSLFDGVGRPVVANAIGRTLALPIKTIAEILTEISDAMLHSTRDYNARGR